MKRKSIITLLLVFSVLCCFCVPASAGSMNGFKPVKVYYGNFKDINSNAWYYNFVKTCYEYGLVVGTSDTIYAPNAPLTTAELLAVACRIRCIYYDGYNSIEANDTGTTPGPWYQMYINYAINNGIIAVGEIADADYTKPASRALMVHIFSKVLPASEFPTYNVIDSIPDMTVTDKYYYDILTFYKAGILVGTDNKGTFAPERSCTRAEASTIFSMIVVPSLRTGYTTPPVTLKSYSGKFTNTTITFDAPTDYAVSALYGKTVVESKATGIVTSIDALRDSTLADITIAKLFNEAEISEFYETDFAQSSDPISVTYCEAQPIYYGTITAYKVKISYTLYGSSFICYAVTFITDSTLFEILFDGPVNSVALSQMVDSFAVNGHNMYAK